MKILTIAILAFSAFAVFGQSSKNLRMTYKMAGKDTLEIRRFDKNQKEVFFKAFPQYGVSQIITHTYDNEKLVNKTWTHSNAGILIFDYEYDSVENTRTTYSYKHGVSEKAIGNLMIYNDDVQLKQSPQYLELHYPANRYLHAIAFYTDTFLVKEIEFKQSGDTAEITSCTYQNGKLKSKRLSIPERKYFNELVYDYDANGNETQWMKIFNGTDTAYAFQKRYENNKLVEEREMSGEEIEGFTTYEYSSGLLVTEKSYDASNNLRRIKKYYYNANGTVSKVDDTGGTTFYVYK